ncbi:MAG TPA: hypothetical protein VE223_00340 [Nitrososphaeraceae archaeon]|nr:hypothetical protein [Nitrososphaeraceae archaeon]
MKKDLKLTIAGSTGFVIAAASILVLGIAITSISNLSVPTTVSAMTMMPGNQTAGHGASNMTAGSGTSMASTAKMHLEEGMKALQSGDTQGAMMHLKLADKTLGGTG